MRQNCNSVLGSVLPIVLATVLAGCDTEKSRNPLSPSIAGPIEGVVISAPTPVAPAGGFLIKIGDQPIQLTFEPATSNSERPFWYELQVATDSVFSHVVHASEEVPAGTEPTQSYPLPNMLDPEQTCNWRVRALDGANTGPFSAPAAFDVYTPLSISAPEPTSPVGGAVTDSRQATLVVNNAPITGPASSVSYRFEVARDAAFGAIVTVLTVASSGATTAATTGDLDWDTTYHWRAQAVAQGREGQVVGPWSDAATFRTALQPVELGTPILVSPINGQTASSNPPVFTVTNGSVSGPAGPVTIFFQVATDASFNDVIARFDKPSSGTGTTSATSPGLPHDSHLYWRVFSGDGPTVSAWTTPQTFRTPEAPPSPSPPPPTGPAPEPFCCPPPNRFEVVKQVAAETGYPSSGIHVSDFTQVVAERLAQEDSNWGRRINITGPIGKDTVAYRVNGQDDNPFSIDIVGGAGGSNPSIHWDAHGQIGGTWIPVN